MQNGVCNHALIHDHHNASRKPHYQGNPKQIAGTINKAAGQFFLTQTSNQTDQDRRTEKQRPHARHPPALGGHTPDHYGEGQCENHQGDDLSGVQRGVLELGIMALQEQLTVGIPLFGYDGVRRVGFNTHGVTHNVS